MNIILVLIDSLNRGDLAAYTPSECATPNLEAFAKKAWRFDNHFVGSLPCMPARREIYAGIREFLWRPWGPLELFDVRLPRLLEDRGYATAIVTDHYGPPGEKTVLPCATRLYVEYQLGGPTAIRSMGPPMPRHGRRAFPM